jgi:hypothetical protein
MPEDTIFEPSAIDKVRIVGTKHILTYVALYLGLGVLFALAAAIFGAWMELPYVSWASALLFFACGLKAVAVVLENERETRQKIGNLINAGVALIYAEIRTKTAAPAAPALPAALENAKATDASGVGEVFTGRKLHGYPIITVEYMCNYLANKNEWTESRMERMPVMYVYPLTYFGKAEKGNPYYDFFHHERGMFCRAGVLIERGGPGNPKGKLTTTNAVEMMERIKALPETDTLNA